MGLSAVLLCMETRRRASIVGVTFFLEHNVQGSLQRSDGFCVVVAADFHVEANGHAKSAERWTLMRHAEAAELSFEASKVLSSSEFPNCRIESVMRNWGLHCVDKLTDSRTFQKHVLRRFCVFLGSLMLTMPYTFS